MEEKIFLGCDIGTGSCKMLAWRPSGVIIKEAQSFYEVHHPQDGFSEQDPETIRNAFVECAQKVMHDLPANPAAIGFSSCMHSLIPVDDACKPLYPMITWEDNRSYDIAEKLRKSEAGKRLYTDTGTPIHSMSPLCKIIWFRENKPDLFKNTAKFIGIKEYLWYWMFGEFEVDQSIASATGLFNIRRLTWDAEALQHCRIEGDRLSRPVQTTFSRSEPAPNFLVETGLPPDLIFCIGASDGCMANAGSRIDSPGKAAVTIGTSGAVRVTCHEPIVDYESMIFNYLLDEKTFVSGGPVNNGGNTLHWVFKEFLGIHDPRAQDYSSFESSISLIPPGCDGLLCLPWFYGERAPVWDEKASGIWLGVTYKHTKFHLMRAVMEGVCYTLRMIMEQIEKKSEPIVELFVSGGFIRSPQWVQMLADITQKKVVINELADASSIGAAMWAMKAAGMGQDYLKMEKEKIILPQKDFSAVLNRQFRIFSQLYQLTKKQMHLLRE